MSGRRPRTMRIDERNVVERPAVTARKPSAAPPSGFTPGEWTEFRNLLREPQPTFGSSRSRMQNALVRKGFAEFVEVDGSDRCSATPAGREAARHAP